MNLKTPITIFLDISRIFISLLAMTFVLSGYAVDAYNNETLSTGGYHTCVIDDLGLACWGRNHEGQTNVPDLSNPKQVSSGELHTCAIDDSGVVCWGNDSYGQATVPLLSNPTQIATGPYNACAIKAR